MMPLHTYFKDTELACRCCGVVKLAAGFADDLVALREKAGHALIVNSCCRCRLHNGRVGGVDGSFHQFDAPDKTGVVGTCAIDISIANWPATKTWEFVRHAMDTGWSIGINWKHKFVHLDRRIDHATGWAMPAMFAY